MKTPQLIYSDTREPVQVGDLVDITKWRHFAPDDIPFEQREFVTVHSFDHPHKPSSSGKVLVREYPSGPLREVYVSVIGAEWINRNDRD